MSGVISQIYNWGASAMQYIWGDDEAVGLAACTSAPNYQAAPNSPAASDPITLEQPEIDAIMNMEEGRGNSCNLHNLYRGPNPGFWNDAARYIIENKFSADFRNEEGRGIRDALASLAPNQRAAVRERLAAELDRIGDPLQALNERDYLLGCARGLFAATAPYPTLRLNVTYAQLTQIIETVTREVAAETVPAAGQGPTRDTPEAIVQAFNALEENNRAQVLRQIDPDYFICLADPENTVEPNSGRQGQSLSRVVLHGYADNLYLENDQLPDGLTISFGPDITVSNPRVVDGQIAVDIDISTGAALDKRAVTITLNNAEIGSLSNAFEVTRGRGSSGASPAPSHTATAAPSAPPAPSPTPPPPTPTPPPPSGNPFEL